MAPKPGFNLLNKDSLLAAAGCAAILCSTSLLLVFFSAAGRISGDLAFFFFVGMVFASLPLMIELNRQTNRLIDRNFSGDPSPPDRRFKLLYGASLGFMAGLATAVLGLAWLLYNA